MDSLAPADSDANTEDASPTATPALTITTTDAAVDHSGLNGTQQRPAKRRRLEAISLRRAVSPPWKSFTADGPTTVFENGVRKSSRVNREAAPPPIHKSVKQSLRRTGQASPVKIPTRPVGRPRSRGNPRPAAAIQTKPLSPLPKTPARQSVRQRKPSASGQDAVLSSSDVCQNLSGVARRKSARPRRAAPTCAEKHSTFASTPKHDPDAGLYALLDSDGSSSAPARLRLHLPKAAPPNRHPQHLARNTHYASLTEWLIRDDPLEGDEWQRITLNEAKSEADRRLEIERAVDSGVLSQGQCSAFVPLPAPEPPRLYSHWDFVAAHAQHFSKLLRDEQLHHRKQAKVLAREAYEYWRNKFKQKSLEDIEREDHERQASRYKQLVKDIKETWANVRMEVDRERLARWEEEQLQLGHKAMDDMFNHAQEILNRNFADTASSLATDDEHTDTDNDLLSGDESRGSDACLHDDVMSSSSDSEDESAKDVDSQLTAEQLRAKYGNLSGQLDHSLPSSESSDHSGEESVSEIDEDFVQTLYAPHFPQVGDPIYSNGFLATKSVKEEKIDGYDGDPATVELDHVDSTLLDLEDETRTSESGSEAWASDEESGEEFSLPDFGEDDADSDSTDDDGYQDSSGDENVKDAARGLMGFLTPKDIKELKDAAKLIVSQVSHQPVACDHVRSRDEDMSLPHVLYNHGHDHDYDQGEDKDKNQENNNGHVPDQSIDSSPSSVHRKLIPMAPQVIRTADCSSDDENSEAVVQYCHGQQEDGHSVDPSRIEVPSLLRGTLRAYQHDGLNWLVNLYDSETNGILADEMGLGKTIQTISLLAHLAVKREVWGPHLVVVPTSVMLNWEMEFKKFLPGFKILTYYGDISERKRKRLGWRDTGKDMYNVVITSYQLILQDANAFKMRAWHYLVLDEAHNIKNFKSQRWQTMLNLRTQRRLLLTGTPLQNNIDELWSLLYFLMPAGFAGEGRIAGLEEFTLALKNPTSQILDQGRQELDAEAQRIVKRLHEVLRPYLLRRLKSEVEKQMPAKYEHVVYCKLSKRQRQLYDGFMGRASTKEILSSGNYMSIINCLMSLRKVCNHPDLFETRAIVTSMVMPTSVPAQFTTKDILIRKRLLETKEDTDINLDALGFVLHRREQTRLSHARRVHQIRATRPLEDLVERQTRRIRKIGDEANPSVESTIATMSLKERIGIRDHLRLCLDVTRARTQTLPSYGKDIIDFVTVDWQTYTFGARNEGCRVQKSKYPHLHQEVQCLTPFQSTASHLHVGIGTKPSERESAAEFVTKSNHHGNLGFRAYASVSTALEWSHQQVKHFYDLVPTAKQHAERLESLITQFTCVTPNVVAEDLTSLTLSSQVVDLIRANETGETSDPFHEARMRQSIAFPDKRLLQYDCGKLQRLAVLLRDLQAGGHRALIFTQMTKVLDILEQFLNIHGHRYLRLDGSTKIEQRQILTDRFNNDPRILCFILSSRSGGLGINLTGADTVIFYDLDWNPAMDKQCQDRAHRIGQTRDVHIYKLVSEYTIEANILRKSNQKRLLDDVIIQKGDFTTDTFNRVTWRDAFDDSMGLDTSDEAGAAMDRVLGDKAGLLGDAHVMGTVEDVEDRNAASVAQKEIVDEIHDDRVDFNEFSNATRAGSEVGNLQNFDLNAGGVEQERRHVDEYMLKLYREEFGTVPYKPSLERQKRNRKGQDPHVRQRKRKH